MSQPTQYIYDVVLTMKVTVGKTYTSAEIIALAPAGTTPKVIILLSNTAMIGVGGGDAVTWARGDSAYLVTGRSWTFTTSAELALAQLVNLLV